jgi:hypothetical protein
MDPNVSHGHTMSHSVLVELVQCFPMECVACDCASVICIKCNECSQACSMFYSVVQAKITVQPNCMFQGCGIALALALPFPFFCITGVARQEAPVVARSCLYWLISTCNNQSRSTPQNCHQSQSQCNTAEEETDVSLLVAAAEYNTIVRHQLTACDTGLLTLNSIQLLTYSHLCIVSFCHVEYQVGFYCAPGAGGAPAEGALGDAPLTLRPRLGAAPGAVAGASPSTELALLAAVAGWARGVTRRFLGAAAAAGGGAVLLGAAVGAEDEGAGAGAAGAGASAAARTALRWAGSSSSTGTGVPLPARLTLAPLATLTPRVGGAAMGLLVRWGPAAGPAARAAAAALSAAAALLSAAAALASASLTRCSAAATCWLADAALVSAACARAARADLCGVSHANTCKQSDHCVQLCFYSAVPVNDMLVN